jgi:uncharacterized 2Fe-2S/4Fe-4S cluster protein (DUF4445 family)
MHAEQTPWVQTVSLTAPTLLDNTADADRLINALKVRLNTQIIDVDLDLVRILPDLLRKCQYRVCCILFKNRIGWRLIGIIPTEDPAPIAGLAVDLGTTRIVLRLLDFKTGGIIAESAIDNPQKVVGPDILARIHYADQPGGLQMLNHLIVSALNEAIGNLCQPLRMAPENIYALSIAGNTTMTHFFMGLNPRYIVREPYIPAVNTPAVLKARALGMRVNPLAEVLIFPNIGSYFGGDLIAGILYSKIYRQEEISILIDVGTNAEVVLGNRNWLIGCAGAAGPALEGGVTRMGTTAAPGVIDKIRIDPDSHEFETHTIDGLPPKGICGSGLIDLAAQLFIAGMIDIRGKLMPQVCGSRLKEMDGRLHLVVVPADRSGTGEDLTISQADFDSLIRSKAAMYTILETLTASVGITLRDLSAFYVAGTFGAFIDPRSAISIGMLPDLPPERYIPLGNSSLEGATLALQSDNYLAEIDMIREGITYLELNVNQEFMNRFSAAKFLPHTDRSLFPSVKARPRP